MLLGMVLGRLCAVVGRMDRMSMRGVRMMRRFRDAWQQIGDAPHLCVPSYGPPLQSESRRATFHRLCNRLVTDFRQSDDRPKRAGEVKRNQSKSSLGHRANL